jgi:hypothetical protein
MSCAYVVVGQLGKNILGDDSDVQVLKNIVNYCMYQHDIGIVKVPESSVLQFYYNCMPIWLVKFL